MRSTNLPGCRARAIERGARPVPAAAERAEPTVNVAAAWLVKRHRVRPNLAATVASLAGLGGR